MKTKAQMNWEVGKEQEEEFLKKLVILIPSEVDFLQWTKDFLYQIRQNEYRRGKEDAKNEILKIIDDILWIKNRILAEHRKHSEGLPDHWAFLAAIKIKSELKEIINEQI